MATTTKVEGIGASTKPTRSILKKQNAPNAIQTTADDGADHSIAQIRSEPTELQELTDPTPAKPSKKWQAEESDWNNLQEDRFNRAWQMAALSLGLKNISTINERLDAAGRVDEKRALRRLENNLQRNLTCEKDPDRLQYVIGSLDDLCVSDPSATSLERVIDVVEFVRYAKRRGRKVHARMEEIARAFEGTSNVPITPLDLVPQTAVDKPRAGYSSEKLTVGLLMMYLRHLADENKAPPASLLKGERKPRLINASTLALELISFSENRTDQDSVRQEKTSCINDVTLRKLLGSAQKLFGDHIFVEVCQDQSVMAK